MARELPKQFEEFGEARQKGFLKVKNIKDNGGKVAGVFCTFTPLEILDAAGFTPVSLCGMSGETIPAAEALPANKIKLRLRRIGQMPVYLFFGHNSGRNNMRRQKENV